MSALFDPTPFLERERASVAAGVAPLLQRQSATATGAQPSDKSPYIAHKRGAVAAVAPVAGGSGFEPDLSALPRHWQTALQRLANAKAPGSAARWAQIQADATQLALRFGSVADSLGWDVVSVFGYHGEHDDVGLVLQMQGRSVVAMSQGEAVIRTGERQWHICRPLVPEGTVLLWRADEFKPPG